MGSLQCALVLLVKRSSWGPDGVENGGLSSLAPQNLPWQQVCWEEMRMASSPFSTSLSRPELKPKPSSACAPKLSSVPLSPLDSSSHSVHLPLVLVLLRVQWLPCLPFYPRLQVCLCLMVSALCILLSSRLKARHLVNLSQQLPRGKVYCERV